MRIILDCHGGDHCPSAAVDGALAALQKNPDLTLVLCGIESDLRACLQGKQYDTARLSILPAEQTITNEDSPTLAIRRKKQSSMVLALQQVREGAVDGIVSAGNTGALLVGASILVGLIPGVTRACLAPVLPTLDPDRSVVMVDGGANVDCRVEMYREFAVMGDAFMRSVYGIERPRIGLLSNGAEAEKGNEITKQAHALLADSGLNFVGNVEARYVMNNVCDVLVTDGWGGNIVLKASEGMALNLFEMMKQHILASGLRGKIGYLLLKPALRKVKYRMSGDETGGGAFLGTRGVVVKAHGSSKAVAFCNAILLADKLAQNKLVDRIRDGLRATKEEQE